MPRPTKLIFLVVILAITLGGGGAAWRHYSVRTDWAALRPALPAPVGDAAPGLDRRLESLAGRLETWPPDRAALAEFSQVCHANGLLPEAISGYRALLKVDPTEGRWPHLLAILLAGAGRLDEAVSLWRQATELAPAQTIVWLRLGDAHLKLNQLADAETAYQQALRRAPDNVQILFGLARCDLQAGRLTGARSRLLQATAAHPDFPGAQSLLAMVYDRLGNPEAAALARSRVTGDGRYTAAPDPWALDLAALGHNPYVLLTAASAEASDGQPQKAVPLLRRALELTPNDARLHRQLGNTLARLGETPAALAALEHALTLAPDDEKIRNDLLKGLRVAKDSARLEQVVLAGTQTNPDSAAFQFEAGLLSARAGRPEEAAAYFQRAWKLRPEETDAPCELAAVYLGSNRPAEGLAVLGQVLQSHPGNATALTMLVRHGIATGDPRTADWLRQLSTQSAPVNELADLRRAYARRFGNAP